MVVNLTIDHKDENERHALNFNYLDDVIDLKQEAKLYWQMVKDTFNDYWQLKNENKKLHDSLQNFPKTQKIKGTKFYSEMMKILNLDDTELSLLTQPKRVIEITLLDYLRALFEEGQKLSELVLEVREILGLGKDVDIQGMFDQLQLLKLQVYQQEEQYVNPKMLEKSQKFTKKNQGKMVKKFVKSHNSQKTKINQHGVVEVIQEVEEEGDESKRDFFNGDNASEEDFR